MKVIHLSTSDTNGGAAIAARRIVRAQQSLNNIESKLLVQTKFSKDEFVLSIQQTFFDKYITFSRKLFDEISIRLFSIQSRGRFSFPFLGEDISKNLLIKNSDIINLHWINGGFLSLKSLEKLVELKKPVVWTLHDMWAFTGGCHYASDCKKYVEHCSNCPSLFFKSNRDCSNKIFNKKLELFKRLNLTVITPSNWLASEASQSKLLREEKILVIPNPIQSEIYKPLDKRAAKSELRLPDNKKIILIGAMNLRDERKGYRFLIEALNILKNYKLDIDVELAVFGKLKNEFLHIIPVKIHQLGKLKTENEVIKAYNSADLFVAPSLQDNLPNTVMEAMACGVPVVAFNVGGISDMIDHNLNGILAKPRSSEELADGIKLLLTDDNLRRTFSKNARDKVVKNFDEKIVAEKYLEVYKSLI